jgi:Domain of unknown function (DUF6487)
MNCPKCNKPMEAGWLALYNPIVGTKLVWQAVKPGYVRLRMPTGSARVMQARLWGRGCPEGFICMACKLTLFSYDEENVT